ncbi:MAG: J domain-containing protein [Candidatus Methanofastidiosia archaeon]
MLNSSLEFSMFIEANPIVEIVQKSYPITLFQLILLLEIIIILIELFLIYMKPSKRKREFLGLRDSVIKELERLYESFENKNGREFKSYREQILSDLETLKTLQLFEYEILEEIQSRCESLSEYLLDKEYPKLKKEIEEAKRILGIENLDEGEVKKRYRTLTKLYHPDISDDEDSQKKMAEINRAYNILKNNF